MSGTGLRAVAVAAVARRAGAGRMSGCRAGAVAAVAPSGRVAAGVPLRSPPAAARAGQVTAQVEPFSANEVGPPVSPAWVAWKPMFTDAFGAMVALYATLRAVTAPPVGE
ncbi:hypothetical protein GA0070606_0137 [Micromonospora citrea]|uniref:Uncharacterized protein n=1 Tax=Micromonospora citrea TaxID=47855 RepID=A0A1C6TR20_9ACTN|nr:hypothetical protein GA0070606_0137 [Micromonospora citrea]